VPRIASQHGLERSSRFAIFVEAGLAPKRAELHPDVIEIEFAEEEQRRFIVRVGLEPCARQLLALCSVAQERRHHGLTRSALLEGFVLITGVGERRLDLEQQRGCAELVGGKIFWIRRA